MLRVLKHCLFLIFFVSAFAQQPDDGTSLIKDSRLVAEVLCIGADDIQNQGSDADND